MPGSIRKSLPIIEIGGEGTGIRSTLIIGNVTLKPTGGQNGYIHSSRTSNSPVDPKGGRMRYFASLLLLLFTTVAYAKLPCIATDSTPCVKRSGVHWCWKPAATHEDCFEEGTQSLVIVKDPETNEAYKTYCITVRQGEAVTKIFAGSTKSIPGEIVRDMFCGWEE